MTFSIYINQPKLVEWGISYKASALLSLFSQLSTWANPVTIDNEVYYLLYRTKIQKELPSLGSMQSVTRIIAELEGKGIIESVLKNSTPAYRLSAKGKEWTSTTLSANDGEKSNGGEGGISPVKEDEEKAVFSFVLKEATKYNDLTSVYTEALDYVCKEYAERVHIPLVEYDDFINWHSSKGSRFEDWTKAFKYWCSNYRKKHPNVGESKDDYFSVNGRGLYE